MSNIKNISIPLFRNLKIVVHRIWPSITVMTTAIFSSAIYMSTLPEYNGSFLKALYHSVVLSALMEPLDFPCDTFLRILFFVMPLVGIFSGIHFIKEVVIAAGSKMKRDQDWEVALAKQYRNHIIVCGLGRKGMQVVNGLVERGKRWKIVVVQGNEDSLFVRDVLNLGIPVILGDMTRPSVLERANVKQASVIVMTVDDDRAVFKTIKKLSDIIKPQNRIDILFHLFDSGVAQILKTNSQNILSPIRLLPIDLSSEIARIIVGRIEKLGDIKSLKYAIAGIGRVGYTVMNSLIDHGVSGSNIWIIDNNEKNNIFLSKEHPLSIPIENRHRMDVLEFGTSVVSQCFDVIIITTGDDYSNLVFAHRSIPAKLTIVRTRSDSNWFNEARTEGQGEMIWINTTKESAWRILAYWDRENRSSK